MGPLRAVLLGLKDCRTSCGIRQGLSGPLSCVSVLRNPCRDRTGWEGEGELARPCGAFSQSVQRWSSPAELGRLQENPGLWNWLLSRQGACAAGSKLGHASGLGFPEAAPLLLQQLFVSSPIRAPPTPPGEPQGRFRPTLDKQSRQRQPLCQCKFFPSKSQPIPTGPACDRPRLMATRH